MWSASLSANYRRLRMERLASKINGRGLGKISVLDIGGTRSYWDANLQYLPDHSVAEIDIVNLPPQDSSIEEVDGVTIRSYAGDALDFSTFRKTEYDLVHSNSVIEHVGNLSSQKIMADSITRLGRYYWVQSPAKSFPLEPHFYFPFFAYLPLTVRAALLRNFDLGFHTKQSDWLESKIVCEDTRLLTKKEYQHLFSSAQILDEKVFFLTKSYIAANL